MNQPEVASRLLSNLKDQVNSECEIIIKDDSPTDETEIIVSEFQTFFKSNIQYFRGKPEGIDKTIIFLTEKAQGEFLWWVGDDEITANSLTNILETISRKRDLGLIWANYLYQDSGQSLLAFDLGQNKYFTDRNEVLLKARTGLGFISSTIIRADIAKNNLAKSKKYIGTEFVNLFLVLSVLSSDYKSYFLRGPIIINHPKTETDFLDIKVKNNGEIVNKAFEVFGVHFKNILLSFSNKFNKKVLKLVLKKTYRSAWKGMFVGWVGGWDTPNGKKIKLIKNFYYRPETWLAILLFSLPRKVNILMYQTYRKIKSHSLKRI